MLHLQGKRLKMIAQGFKISVEILKPCAIILSRLPLQNVQDVNAVVLSCSPRVTLMEYE